MAQPNHERPRPVKALQEIRLGPTRRNPWEFKASYTIKVHKTGRKALSSSGGTLSMQDYSNTRFNLNKASVLLLDSTTMGLSVLAQIIKGFGAHSIHRCTDINDAKSIARTQRLHLSIIDAQSPSAGGYEFVQWMRREAPEPNSFSSIIVIEGHTRASGVAKARDAGANFMMKRPLSPLQLMERIMWIGSEDRSFVSGASYAGPDRRFHDDGPPATCGRRWNDPKPVAAESAEGEDQSHSSGTEATP